MDIPGTATTLARADQIWKRGLTIKEMKTGESAMSPCPHLIMTHLSCRAAPHEDAISVTDRLEVLVAKIHSGLVISYISGKIRRGAGLTWLYRPSI